jgi:ABC-type cobalamin/Fe3+-siderophores transport system ATPase subunit
MTLSLREVALLHHGPVISLDIAAGQTVCVVGPAAAGKGKLLRAMSGQEQVDRGKISRPGKVALPSRCNVRLRPQDLSHKKGSNQAALATEVLSHLRLWDVRQSLISDLLETQIAACNLVEVLMGNGGLIVLDGQLDALDPWTRAGAMKLIRDRCAHGAICVVATNDLSLASQFDFLIVLKEHQSVFHGAVSELTNMRGQRTLTIESERNVGVRALVDPLLVGITRTETGYKLQPGPGQEHTARMLREGYGDVKYVVSDQKSLAEIILAMIA